MKGLTARQKHVLDKLSTGAKTAAEMATMHHTTAQISHTIDKMKLRKLVHTSSYRQVGFGIHAVYSLGEGRNVTRAEFFKKNELTMPMNMKASQVGRRPYDELVVDPLLMAFGVFERRVA